jgi:uncharacterized protein
MPEVSTLANRLLTYTIHPLVMQELGKKFNLESVLSHGLLPAVTHHPEPHKYLVNYVQTYVREEILHRGLTRNVNAFIRFMQVASLWQGQILNHSEVARDLQINRLTIANYFDILEDIFLGVRISSFMQPDKRKTVVHQKFYFFDVGMYKALRPTGGLEVPPEPENASLETLFLQSLRAINDYHELGYKIHFWRTLTGDDVAFVIHGPRGFYAFDIVRSSKIHTKFFKGLSSFAQDYPQAKLFLLYLGKHQEQHGDVTVIPYMHALQDLPHLIG